MRNLEERLWDKLFTKEELKKFNKIYCQLFNQRVCQKQWRWKIQLGAIAGNCAILCNQCDGS